MSDTITMLRVYADPRYMKRIRITCRCEHAWVETLPQELHDALHLATIFNCEKCGTQYRLHAKTLKRVKEDTNDRPEQLPPTGGEARHKYGYDA